LIFPYRVKCVTIAKTKAIASSKYLFNEVCPVFCFFKEREGFWEGKSENSSKAREIVFFISRIAK
jgi:hypothetical protein